MIDTNLIYKDICDNWDNYYKEFTDNESSKPEHYEDAIWEYINKGIDDLNY